MHGGSFGAKNTQVAGRREINDVATGLIHFHTCILGIVQFIFPQFATCYIFLLTPHNWSVRCVSVTQNKLNCQKGGHKLTAPWMLLFVKFVYYGISWPQCMSGRWSKINFLFLIPAQVSHFKPPLQFFYLRMKPLRGHIWYCLLIFPLLFYMVMIHYTQKLRILNILNFIV